MGHPIDPLHQSRIDLATQLRTRQLEVERVALLRLRSVGDVDTTDPEYLYGMKQAIKAHLNYELSAIENTKDLTAPVPEEMTSQARLAARSGVGLDVLLRRCTAAHTVVGEFLIEEAERFTRPQSSTFNRLLSPHAHLLDRMLRALSDAHGAATTAASPSRSPALNRVSKLLAGELSDIELPGYDLSAYHLATVGHGNDAKSQIKQLATALPCQMLLVQPAEDVVWAWLGTIQTVSASALRSALVSVESGEAALGLGQSRHGRNGWRISHHQAKAALPIAENSDVKAVSYSEVALVAAAFRDELLADSFRTSFLNPLTKSRSDGTTLCKTLRAYFDAGGNGSSAAASLGVSRQTISNRLQNIEALIGRPLTTCSAEIDIALRYAEVFGEI